MRRILFLLLLILFGLPAAAQHVVLVRHAEKADDGTSDPPLTEAGHARADALATLLGTGVPSAVISSPFRRTLDTAAPVATAAGLDVVVIPVSGGLAAHIDAVAESVRGYPADEVVLVVGHSNTIPAIIGALGGPRLPDIDDHEYNRLFFLRVDVDGGFSEVRFGSAWKPSPDGSDALFFDDFDGPELDRSKWNVEGPAFWVNNEQQAYIDSDRTVYLADVEGASNGALVLHPRFEAGFETPRGRVVDFVSGRINSRGLFDFTHGRAEARIKLPDAAGLWPAWWLLGNGRWPATGEIDIMEFVGERDWVASAIHGPGYSGDTPLVNKFFFPEAVGVTDWHVYAVEWSTDEIVFLVDERVTYRVTRPMIEHYGEWRFDTPKYLILNFALGGAYPFKTNGVESPYNGLPAATVDAIRADRIAMYVDWVRVTQTP